MCHLNFLFLPYRDGVEWLFVKLHEKHVPLLIISGGLGGMMKVQNIFIAGLSLRGGDWGFPPVIN